jgi:hypothetical protein
LVSVPATIITSDWRGDERGAKPVRSLHVVFPLRRLAVFAWVQTDIV